MTDAPSLERKSLAQIITFWRPGSSDLSWWSWADEYEDLMVRDHAVTNAVRQRVGLEGFGFHDHIAPILLGSNGRVWDGHHRICLALQQNVHYLMVETTEKDSSCLPS